MKDDLFARGERVPMTKEEIRAVALSKMEIFTAENFLDIGAGSGSVGIEAARMRAGLSVTGIEINKSACEIIKKNVEIFNIENYNIIHGEAPMKISGEFDRIFIGGSGGALKSILEWCKELLSPDGIIVGNFIVIENAMETFKYYKDSIGFNVEMIQLTVSRVSKMGRYEYLKPVNPVFIIKAKRKKSNE